jgi:hypothetical protein
MIIIAAKVRFVRLVGFPWNVGRTVKQGRKTSRQPVMDRARSHPTPASVCRIGGSRSETALLVRVGSRLNDGPSSQALHDFYFGRAVVPVLATGRRGPGAALPNTDRDDWAPVRRGRDGERGRGSASQRSRCGCRTRQQTGPVKRRVACGSVEKQSFLRADTVADPIGLGSCWLPARSKGSVPALTGPVRYDLPMLVVPVPSGQAQ